ncbi:RidA family protein [Telmatospirillum sp.]|uniref:RidA family protein n=1 Tax=Telmatospirillum sp. TaxID=2079197 RepID=UPI0028455699|nr:RidA family protein [Telmatospirillum sp.]MDR3435621.1 RidA family protein [Telmatospirillum sp.]
MVKFETRLAELGITLPVASVPAANYVSSVVSGNQLILSGQLPVKDGKLAYCGRLGDGVSIEDGYQAARLCAINLIAQIKAAIGDLDRVARIVRLGGYVNCTPDFTNQPKVVNGASDLMVEVFGDAGRHARSAIGCPSLPLGVSVEVDAVVELSKAP